MKSKGKAQAGAAYKLFRVQWKEAIDSAPPRVGERV